MANIESDSRFRHVYTPKLAETLEALQSTLVISTYQAGKIVFIRSEKCRISTLFRSFDQPMGVAADRTRIIVGTRDQVWELRNAPAVAQSLPSAVPHDACFLPRSSHVTGDISVHEIAVADNDLWVVNTRFSCLCTLHNDFSFVPRWRPPFITELTAEDRCHLNGIAVMNGKPAYVTAFGATNSPEGWRSGKADSGVLIDVTSGKTIANGLSMPHSPRVHDGKLWVLDSGTGRVLIVDPTSGRIETITALPGYVRGLAFLGRYAFVGLSKIRETATFGGLAIVEKLKELKCGVWVIETATGQTVGFVEFESGVEEIFDVQLLPGIRFPAIIGFQKEAIRGTFVIPHDVSDEASPRAKSL